MARERNQRIADGQATTAAPVDPNQWHVLNTILSLSDEQQQQKQRLDEIERKKKHKELLDRQNAERQLKLLQQEQEKARQKEAIQK